MSPLLSWITEELKTLHANQLFRSRRVVRSLPNGICEFEGERLYDFSSNDYLNLAHDPRIIEAAMKVLQQEALGARASALVIGRSKYHEQLEERIASFEGKEAAILFPSGYAANVGTITALAGKQDVIFCDRFNHASLIDGCRLSQAKLQVYRHNRLEELKQRLQKSDSYRHRFIITDSVFSMDGDVAPLRELAEIAQQYDASLVIDEAHATGVYGHQGRGVAEWLEVESHIAVPIGTLSKAVGTQGGFVAGNQTLIDWLWNKARTQIYSTALPPAICAATLVAFDIIEAEPEQRIQYLQRVTEFHRMLREAGIDFSEHVSGPIVPVILHDETQTLECSRKLQQRGFLVPAIRPPTVPMGTSRLRIAITAAHTAEVLQSLTEALASEVALIQNRLSDER